MQYDCKNGVFGTFDSFEKGSILSKWLNFPHSEKKQNNLQSEYAASSG